MLLKILFTGLFTFLISAGLLSQEIKESKSKDKKNSKSVNKESPVNETQISPKPDVQKETKSEEFELKEEIEESPNKGEPVIGSEVFEEQNPALPDPENKNKKEKQKNKEGKKEE